MSAVNHNALLIHGLSNARRNRARIDCWLRRAILSITARARASVRPASLIAAVNILIGNLELSAGRNSLSVGRAAVLKPDIRPGHNNVSRQYINIRLVRKQTLPLYSPPGASAHRMHLLLRESRDIVLSRRGLLVIPLTRFTIKRYRHHAATRRARITGRN